MLSDIEPGTSRREGARPGRADDGLAGTRADGRQDREADKETDRRDSGETRIINYSAQR